ncbi:hypothetical protein BZA77DRAFT_298443 [Pyronema omphalodes]|nr:hypothetical protein BZA77DRAFT_298443 [Pyronema omphalodes]
MSVLNSTQAVGIPAESMALPPCIPLARTSTWNPSYVGTHLVLSIPPFSIVPTHLYYFFNNTMPTDKATAIAAANTAAASEAMQKATSSTRQESLTKYLTAITTEPTNLAARRNLTAVLYEQGDYPACLRAIEAALQYECEDGKRATLMVRRAKCQFFLGDFQEAKNKKVAFEAAASIPRLRPNLVEKRFSNDQVEVQREQILSTIWALVEIIDSLIDGDENFGISWLKCTPGTYKAIQQVFIGWVSQANYLTEIFDVGYAQAVVGIRRFAVHEELIQTGLMGGVLQLEKEWSQYKESRMVYPSRMLTKAKEPELHRLLKELETESPRPEQAC